MVNTMLGDLQQKDMQTIGVKVASILTGTADVPNMDNRCNVFLVDDIVQAMIDPLGPDLREEFVPDFHGGGDDDRGVSYEPKWPGPSHIIACSRSRRCTRILSLSLGTPRRATISPSSSSSGMGLSSHDLEGRCSLIRVAA